MLSRGRGGGQGVEGPALVVPADVFQYVYDSTMFTILELCHVVGSGSI